jgi:hypothetical protein
MQILIAQGIIACLITAFGVVAIVAGLRTPHPRAQLRAAWIVTGAYFGTGGFLGVLHSGWAAFAFVAGPGTPAWNEYLRWAPVGNHGRGALVVAFAIGLGCLAQTERARVARTVFGTLAAIPIALLIGGTVGWAEGPYISGAHLFALATSNLVQLTVLAIALLLQLSRDTLDRLLWACLAVYSLRLAFGTLWTAANSWFGVAGAVLPRGLTQALLTIVCYLVMLTIAGRYLAHQRRNRYVPSVLEHLRPVSVRLFG